MSGEVEKCPILHVRPKFDVFTLPMSLSFSSYRLFAVFDKFLKYSLIVLPLSTHFTVECNHEKQYGCVMFFFALHSLSTREWRLDLPERPKLPERPPKYRKDQRIIGN